MPDNSRGYLFSEKQVRSAVALGSAGMGVILLALLFLATSRPQGKYQILDGSAHQADLQAAVASITGYEDLGGGRARIDINRAMELVAERGVVNPGFYSAAPMVAPAAPAAAAPPTPATPDASGEAGGGAAVQTSAPALPDGEPLYMSTCSACHQATGMGIPMAFPPLAGHAPELYAADRDYPVEAIAFGLQGSISVHNTTYNGVMPSHLHLQDADIAAILNYVMTAWGNEADLPAGFEPYTAADVEAVRGMMLMATEVHANRVAAGLD
ncbi:MAG: cytochrome c [Trueperaceae bacterium]|nr:cytochrome c [Trueperaceae bacterium]MCO5172805.1 cytochrome c [Trueperaceae bacterium]MCW5819941.1 cytochrome c [Trueperaceae bacterium]